MGGLPAYLCTDPRFDVYPDPKARRLPESDRLTYCHRARRPGYTPDPAMVWSRAFSGQPNPRAQLLHRNFPKPHICHPVTRHSPRLRVLHSAGAKSLFPESGIDRKGISTRSLADLPHLAWVAGALTARVPGMDSLIPKPAKRRSLPMRKRVAEPFAPQLGIGHAGEFVRAWPALLELPARCW